MRLIVTRPEPDGERTAALLRARGHEVLVVPLLRIDWIADADFGDGPWAAVVFTSANAVRAIAMHRRFRAVAALPAYAVGGRTRAAAVAAGFADVSSADGDIDDLVRLIAAAHPGATLPLLYIAGSARAGDLAAALRCHGVQVETVILYRMVAAPDLTAEARVALATWRVDAVLHYSARSAAAFLAAVATAGMEESVSPIRHLCLSPQVAAPLVAAGLGKVEVAAEPNEAALLERLGAS